MYPLHENLKSCHTKDFVSEKTRTIAGQLNDPFQTVGYKPNYILIEWKTPDLIHRNTIGKDEQLVSTSLKIIFFVGPCCEHTCIKLPDTSQYHP